MSEDRNPVDRLGDEFLARVRRGESITPEDYAAAHPHLADQILDVFPALVMLEDARPLGDVTGEFAEPAATPPPERLGEYRILRQIGRGGMGVVYEAVQESLGRHVAVKVLPAPPPGQESNIDRFRREARAAARLHHTNIVPVFGVGSDAGLDYYVMQYIHGQPLDDVLAEVRRLRGGMAAKDSPATEVARHLVSDAFAAPSGTGNPAGERGGESPRSLAENFSKQSPSAHAAGLANSSSFARQPESRYFRACARIAHQAAEGIAYAHAQGVLHRDVKPSNILLDVHGTAWVTDFGLAKLDDVANLTRTGDIVGTLRYMAPERFQGRGDASSDVYALGITLYELLTVRPAFSAKDRLALIEQVTQTSPPAPRSLDRRIPRDLETIVQKATARNSSERYASAAALAEDLGRFLNDQPIQARRQGVVERTWKWAKRRPAAAGLIATLVLAAIGFIGITAWYSEKVAHKHADLTVARRDLDQERDRARATQEVADGNLARANLILADDAWKSEDPLATLIALNDVPSNHRRWEWHYQARRALGSPVTLWGHTETVNSVAFSPDGSRVASASADHTVHLWDARTGALIHTLTGHADVVHSVAFSPDGGRLASSGSDGTVRVWDARTGAPLSTLTGDTNGMFSVAFSPDGSRLASDAGRSVRVWDARTGALIHTLIGDAFGAYAVAFSPDGARLAGGGIDRTVRVWDARTGAPVLTLTGHTDIVHSVAFSPDGTRLATGSFDNTVRLWDAQTGAAVQTLTGHTGRVYSVAFSPDGSWLASGGDATVRLWDARTGALIHSLTGHTGHIWSVAFSPDGARLASGASDYTVRLWDARTATPVPTLTGNDAPVGQVAFSLDGTRLASGSFDNTVRLWDARTGAPVRSLTGHKGWVYAVAFSPDGGRLASGSHDKTVRMWDGWTGALIHTLTGHNAPVICVAFSPDGGRLASGSRDHAVRVWDARTGRLLHTLTGHTADVCSVAFNPDGSQLATGSFDNTVRVWDARTGAMERTLTGHNNRVFTVAFSPDGGRLASGGDDGKVRVWDARTGAPVQILTGHNAAVFAVAFSPDGSCLAGGSNDQTVRVWDARTGTPVQTLTGHTSPVVSVTFSPDSDRLASSSWNWKDEAVRVWDARPATLVRTLTGHTSEAYAVVFSPDGLRLASGGRDYTVRLWDSRTGASERTLAGHTGVVHRLAFSPDGERLASASSDRTVRVWDARTGALIHTLTGHTDLVFGVAFSSDGHWLASAGFDKTVRVWDAWTGAMERMLTGHTRRVRNVVFSRDGGRVAAWDLAFVTKVWDMATGQEIDDADGAHWLAPELARSRSPDGKTLAIPQLNGAILLVTPREPDELELGFREYFWRFDPVWARKRAKECLETRQWSGAKFHLDNCLRADSGDASARLDRARVLLEMNDWSGFLADANVATEQTAADYADDLWLAIGDHARFRDLRKKDREKLAPPGGLPRLFAGLLAAGSSVEAGCLAAALNDAAARLDFAVYRQVISCDPKDADGLGRFAAGPGARAMIAIRRGEAVDYLRHVPEPNAKDHLFQALAELNRDDRLAAHKQLDAAEAWLQAPSKGDGSKTNRVILDNGGRLRVELLRREIRGRLDLNPDEPLKPDR